MQLLSSVKAWVDGELQRAINKANMAAGVVVGQGKTLKHTQNEVHLLMDKVAEAVGIAMQRVFVSYGWLVHATFKVGHYSFAIKCIVRSKRLTQILPVTSH